MNRVDKNIERIRSERSTAIEQRQILEGFKELLPVMTKGDISDVAEVLARVAERGLEEQGESE